MEISGVGKLSILKPCLVKSEEVLLHYYPTDFTVIKFDDFKINFEHSPAEIKLIDEKVPNTLKANVITKVNDKQLFEEIVNLKKHE